MKRQHVLLAVMVALAFAQGHAQAATLEQEKKACRADAFHYCVEDIPIRKKIAACLRRHLDELSPGCRAMFTDRQGGSDDAGPTSAPASTQ